MGDPAGCAAGPDPMPASEAEAAAAIEREVAAAAAPFSQRLGRESSVTETTG